MVLSRAVAASLQQRLGERIVPVAMILGRGRALAQRGLRMSLRHALLISVSALFAGSAVAQTTAPQSPGSNSTAPKATRLQPSAASRAPAPRKPVAPPAAASTPRTLLDALAATYSNQPALQAERAKLRATDENVP